MPAMAPTIQHGGERLEGKRKREKVSVERSSGLVTRVKYCNTLPDIPFDPKFIRYPFDANRFVEYKPTSLEKLHKTELHTDPGLGVVIDLINPDTYKTDVNAWLDPADEALLQEDLPTVQDSKRSKQHSLSVSWLRRSEYISQEFNRYGVKSSNVETRIGAGAKDLFKQEDLYKDRDGQLSAIEKTFEEAKVEITKHYSKPNVYPIEVLPIYPDMRMWQHPSAQVIFDTDPALPGKPVPEQMEEMSQAMIRGMVDEEGDQFVAYFLPTQDTRTKRKRDVSEDLEYNPEEVYDYKLAREYNWNVKNKASKGYEENYYFVFREDGVYYNELETRVRLSKRRARGGGGIQAATNAILAVRHRELNEQEMSAQEMRRMQLEPLEPEDEEEMEVEEAEEGDGENEEGAEEKDDEEVADGEEEDQDAGVEEEDVGDEEEEEDDEQQVGSGAEESNEEEDQNVESGANADEDEDAVEDVEEDEDEEQEAASEDEEQADDDAEVAEAENEEEEEEGEEEEEEEDEDQEVQEEDEDDVESTSSVDELKEKREEIFGSGSDVSDEED